MQKNTQQIIALLQRYLREELNVDELRILQDWADIHPENQKILDKVSDQNLFFDDLKGFQAIPLDSKRTLAHVLINQEQQRPNQDNEKSSKRILMKMRFKFVLPYVAAAVVLIFFLLKLTINTKDNQLIQGIQNVLVQINGSSVPLTGVTITLSDGSTMQLDDTHKGIQMIDNHIYYEDGESVLNAEKHQDVVVSVPRGEQFQVSLSDGSTVLLNAESSLRYPIVFPKGDRKVELTGEAYFSIAKQVESAHSNALVPFIVDFDTYQVQVHGTQFNIRNYKNEDLSKVSLVTGKVSIHGAGHTLEKGIFLSPGLQASLKDNNAKVKHVDLDQEISWKNGLFTFEGKKFQDVMSELARWYDIDVEYQGAIPEVAFFGRAHRKESLLSILNLLKSADITYRLFTYGDNSKKKLIIINKRKEAL